MIDNIRIKRIYLRYNRLSQDALCSCKGKEKSLVKSLLIKSFQPIFSIRYPIDR